MGWATFVARSPTPTQSTQCAAPPPLQSFLLKRPARRPSQREISLGTPQGSSGLRGRTYGNPLSAREESDRERSVNLTRVLLPVAKRGAPHRGLQARLEQSGDAMGGSVVVPVAIPLRPGGTPTPLALVKLFALVAAFTFLTLALFGFRLFLRAAAFGSSLEGRRWRPTCR